MENYLVIENGVVIKCDEKAAEVVIPEGVTEIGAGAFMFCESLESIAIPDGVTEIGKLAFMNCESLKSIAIPDSVTKIESRAFAY